jgi:hypothetical protein
MRSHSSSNGPLGWKPDIHAPVPDEMKPDANHVLKIYLGANENGAYEPLYRDERLRQAFPDSHLQMMEVIAPYLEEDQEPDRTNGDLIQQARRFEAMLRQKFPELDATVARALANRWHFGWSR